MGQILSQCFLKSAIAAGVFNFNMNDIEHEYLSNVENIQNFNPNQMAVAIPQGDVPVCKYYVFTLTDISEEIYSNDDILVRRDVQSSIHLMDLFNIKLNSEFLGYAYEVKGFYLYGSVLDMPHEDGAPYYRRLTVSGWAKQVSYNGPIDNQNNLIWYDCSDNYSCNILFTTIETHNYLAFIAYSPHPYFERRNEVLQILNRVAQQRLLYDEDSGVDSDVSSD